MKKLYCSAFALLLITAAQAQSVTPQVLASGGNYFVGSTFSNSFTVGEMALIDTYTNSGFVLTQGFQQPDYGPLAVVSPELVINCAAYPNPTSGQFAVDYTLRAAAGVTIEVYNLVGERLMTEQLEKTAGTQHDQLDLSAFSNGMYFVRYILNGTGGEKPLMIHRVTLNQ